MNHVSPQGGSISQLYPTCYKAVGTVTFEPGIIARIITVTPIVCLVSTIAIANFELLRKLPHFRRFLRRFIVKSGRGRQKICALCAHPFYINLIHTELPHFANSSYGPVL